MAKMSVNPIATQRLINTFERGDLICFQKQPCMRTVSMTPSKDIEQPTVEISSNVFLSVSVNLKQVENRNHLMQKQMKNEQTLNKTEKRGFLRTMKWKQTPKNVILKYSLHDHIFCSKFFQWQFLFARIHEKICPNFMWQMYLLRNWRANF